jgi:hypothetical protein
MTGAIKPAANRAGHFSSLGKLLYWIVYDQVSY